MINVMNSHILSESAVAVITKYHRLDWLEQKKFLMVLEAGKSKEFQGQLIQFLVRVLLLAFRWLPSHCVLTPWREREGLGFSFPSFEDTNPIKGTPCPWPHLSQITSQSLHLQTPSHQEFGEDRNIQPITHKDKGKKGFSSQWITDVWLLETNCRKYVCMWESQTLAHIRHYLSPCNFTK